MNELVVAESGVNGSLFGTLDLIQQAKDKSIVQASPADQRTWLEGMGHALGAWGDLADYTIMREAETLYHSWTVWEAMNPKDRLHPDALTPWGGDFYAWAKAYMKRRDKDQSTESIQNKIRVYMKWKSEDATIHVPEVVYIPKRQEGNVAVQEPLDVDDWEPLETDLDKVDYSKLLVATTHAEKGMTPEAWGALFDPQATVADLQKALRDEQDGNGDDADPLRFFCQDGIIYAREDGLTEGIAMFLSEEQTSPLFTLGAEHLLKAVGIKGNPFVLTEGGRESIRALAWSAGDEVVVSSKDGYRIGAYSRSEAEEILRVLKEFIGEA